MDCQLALEVQCGHLYARLHFNRFSPSVSRETMLSVKDALTVPFLPEVFLRRKQLSISFADSVVGSFCAWHTTDLSLLVRGPVTD